MSSGQHCLPFSYSFQATGLHFRHTDNVIQWLNAMDDIGLPKVSARGRRVLTLPRKCASLSTGSVVVVFNKVLRISSLSFRK